MHVPVMLAECLDYLNVRPEGVYLDATAGLGGHTGAIARRLESGIVIACDRDAESIELARANTADCADRIRFHQALFSQLEETLAAVKVTQLDGLLAEFSGACRAAGLADGLYDADFVTLHVDLNDETRHLMGPAEFAMMKPSSFIVNTSRGGVVDQVALAWALTEGEIAGAGLDVLEEEPPRTRRPDIERSQLHHPPARRVCDDGDQIRHGAVRGRQPEHGPGGTGVSLRPELTLRCRILRRRRPPCSGSPCPLRAGLLGW